MARLQRWEWIPLTVIFVYLMVTFYDAFVPVLWMTGTIESRPDGGVVLGIKGWKFRECKFNTIQAYSIDASGYLHSADTKRLDRPAQNRTHPIGKLDIGKWDVRPLTGDRGVVVYIQHACSEGDLRLTKVAEVKL